MLPSYSHDTLCDLMRRHSLTGSATARLVGVDSRTLRKWTSAPEVTTHRDMPDSAWWLLLILTGELTVPDLLAYLGIEDRRP